MVDIFIDKQKKREIGIHAERKTETRNNEEKKYIKTASGSNSEGDASALLGGTRGKHQLPPPPPPFPSSSPSPPSPHRLPLPPHSSPAIAMDSCVRHLLPVYYLFAPKATLAQPFRRLPPGHGRVSSDVHRCQVRCACLRAWGRVQKAWPGKRKVMGVYGNPARRDRRTIQPSELQDKDGLWAALGVACCVSDSLAALEWSCGFP